MKNRIFPSLITIGLIAAVFGAVHLWRTSDGSPLDREVASESRKIQVHENRPVQPAAPPKLDLSREYCAKPHATTCGAGWPSYDPTGKVKSDVAGEINALRSMRNIIRENPTWTSEQVQTVLMKAIYTDKRRNRALEAFHWVKKSMIAFIREQPASVFSEGEKKSLVDRISLIQLELPPPASVYSDAMDIVTKNTVYYERTSNGQLRLRMGGAYLLNTTSWYNMVFTLGHELAHAIDPCESKVAGIYPRAYEGVVGCFMEVGWVERGRNTCGDDDQTAEVFADWMAAELTGRGMTVVGKDYSSDDMARAAINATRDLCEQTAAGDSLDFSVHQQPEVRIGSIMGINPTVRRALHCGPPPQKAGYCKF